MTEENNLIMGVDPGLNKTGWGVIRNLNSFDEYIDHGVIVTRKKDNLGQRLNKIYEGLLKIAKKFSPGNIAIEKIFSNTNPETTIKLGKARGIVFLVAARNEIDIFEYAPNTIKKNLVGYGHANKYQMVKMLSRIYPDIKVDSDDAADALAVAICHSMQKNSKIGLSLK